MILRIAVAALMLIAGAAGAWSADSDADAEAYRTKPGFMACSTEKALRELLGYELRKDQRAISAMILAGRARRLKPDMKVYLVKPKGFLHNRVAIRAKGSRTVMWTVSESLERWRHGK